MTDKARFNLKLDAEDKELPSSAASRMGNTTAGLVGSAAMEKAQTLLAQESSVKQRPLNVRYLKNLKTGFQYLGDIRGIFQFPVSLPDSRHREIPGETKLQYPKKQPITAFENKKSL